MEHPLTTWIFQGNPDRFDVDGYLKTVTDPLWTVGQHRLAPEMRLGDRVFMWRSQGTQGEGAGGVVASGTIIEEPEERLDEDSSLPFWVTPPAKALRVRLHIDRVANAKEMLKRDWFKDDPVLNDLRILKFASETNYRVSPEQAHRLESLWLNTGRDWNEAESIAGLWAYAQTYGKELSRLPGSPVVDVALRIGRAVTGVYNKVMNFRSIDPRDSRAGLSGAGDTDRAVWSRFFDEKANALDLAKLDAEYARLWGSRRSPPSLEESDEAAGTRGRGYEADPEVRRAVEVRAMDLAKEHYAKLGFEHTDTASTHPYDLLCTKSGVEEVRVEVKGTRGTGTEIELTAGEVENTRGSDWRTDLFIVSGIVVDRRDGTITTAGGSIKVVEGWRPAGEDLTPTRFRYVVPAT
jgi:hypothetical protein